MAAPWVSLREMDTIFKEDKYLLKVGILTWNILSPKARSPFWSISFPQEKIDPPSVIAWQTSELQAILFIFFKPKFEKEIGIDDKYSKLSSYKFWVCGIHAIK